MISFRRISFAVMAATMSITVAACSTTATKSPRTSPTPSLRPVTAPAGNAAVLQEAFVSVVKKVGPSVVQIETSDGLGSGIIYDSQGYIVTNAHVVGSATSFKVTFADGKVRQATWVGTFVPDDLAVIHVDATGLPAVSLADSNTLQVGDIVMAIGNPLGLRSSVTEGIVSAVGRNVDEGNGNTLPSTIQTSAAINPGNSGGALVDLNGDVVGIPTLAAVDPQLGGSTAPGIGFAIPSNIVRDIAGQLIQNGHVVNSHRAYLGVRVSDLASGGVAVISVESNGAAAKAGVVAGDHITAINGEAVDSVGTLTGILAGLQPGDTITVAVTHQNGNTATLHATLGELPGS